MRSILLGLMLLMVTPVFADVTGEVLGTEQDQNGNIMVKVAYNVDGVNIQTPYPMQDGKYYLVFRLSFENIDGMTPTQIGEFIDKNVTDHCKALITRKATAIENAKLDLKPFTGRKVTVASADIQVSETKAYTVSTVGKVSEKVLIPPTPEKTLDEKIAELQTSISELKTVSEAEVISK
jgi:hypothetical protein